MCLLMHWHNLQDKVPNLMSRVNAMQGRSLEIEMIHHTKGSMLSQRNTEKRPTPSYLELFQASALLCLPDRKFSHLTDLQKRLFIFAFTKAVMFCGRQRI